MKPLNALLVVSLITSLLYGCAAAVVGGAATGATAVHDRRTVGTFIDDEGIELKARLAIFNDRELNSQIHINIISVNGVVLLVGQAPTEAARLKAAEIVSTVPKVRLIHNEMTVAAPNSYMTRSSDALITAKVKAQLFSIKGHPDFDPTRVKVVTENGVVYLMGILKHTEADTVTNEARQVGGVQKVVKLFEYID
ncbi:MAG TPA: BON domain-containing protein [Gammaproteobacteria bacterium]|nr:BON domain-containing protein [Gammaproteobacteria bacterium]